MNVDVMDAVSKHYDSLCDAFADVNDDHVSWRPDLYRKVDKIAPRWQFNALALGRRVPGVSGVINNSYCIKVAECDGLFAGGVFAWPANKAFPGSGHVVREAYLDNIVVLPQHREKGVGASLLDSTKSWAMETGHKSLYTKIVNKNAASLSFYEAAGFKPRSIVFGKHLDISDDVSDDVSGVSGIVGGRMQRFPNGAIAVLISDGGSSLSWSKFEEETEILLFPDLTPKMNTTVLKSAENWAKDRGYPHMRVEVSVNDAHNLRFFEDAGFSADHTNMEFNLG